MTGGSHIRVIEMTPSIGAIVEGVDLSAQLGAAEIGELRCLLLKHRVIFFEDQNLSPSGQRDLAAKFGALHIHPIYPHLPDIPEIVVLDNHTDNPTDNDSWHIDATFLERPPMASILYARQLPSCGGDTLWSDMRAAYLALSEPFRQFLTSLDALHDFSWGFASEILPSKNVGVEQYDRTRRENPPVIHPVIRTHPETGEDSLFANDGFTTRILGLSRSESDHILGMLNHHIQRPEFVVRWRWKPNSVAFWDNRITQHYAVNDYLPQRRVMHRATIAGDRPFHISRKKAVIAVE